MKKLILIVLLGLLAGPSFATLGTGWVGSGVVIDTSLGGTAQEYPNVISDGSGNVIVSWLDKRSGSYAIYAQKYDGSGTAQWSPTTGVTICAASNMATDKALSVNSVYVNMVPDGSGGAIFGWVDYRASGELSKNGDIYAQRIDSTGAVQWAENGKAVCNDNNDQSTLVMASDGGGGALFAWIDTRNLSQDIYTQRLNSAGAPQWTANGLHIYTAADAGSQSGNHPAITDDGGQGAIIAWDNVRVGPGSDVYAQRVTSAGVVSWAANGVQVCANGLDNAGNPNIVADGLGGAVVTWWDSRSHVGMGIYDVYAQRIDGSGTSLWLTNGVTLCAQSAYNDSYAALAIVTDSSHGAIVSWPDYRSSAYCIYAQRVTENGTPEWTADGVAVNTMAGNDGYTLPRLIADGSGGCIIATANYEGVGSTKDIRVHKLNSAGAVPVGWTDGKVVGADTTKDQVDPRIASDGAGGVVVVWKEIKNDPLGDIWGQRVNSGGTYGWGEEITASLGPATQSNAAVCSDGSGGAVVVWQDQRNGGGGGGGLQQAQFGNLKLGDSTYSDIYSQKVDSTGAIKWTAGGVALTNTAASGTNNAHPSICQTSDGKFIVAWATDNSIYVQKLSIDGAAQWAQGGINIMDNSLSAANCGNPAVASDGAGGALVAWYTTGAGTSKQPGGNKSGFRWPDQLLASAYISDTGELDGKLMAQFGGNMGFGAAKYQICYKRIDSNGAVVTPYGGDAQDTMTSGVLATTYNDDTNGEIQLWPALAKVDSEYAMLVWDDWRKVSDVEHWSIRSQKVKIADGSRNLTDDGVAITDSTDTTVSYYPHIASTAGSKSVVAWMESAAFANHDYKIRACTFDGNGNRGSYITVADSANVDEIRPRLAADSTGVFYIVWQQGTWTYATDKTPTDRHPDSPTMSNGAIYSKFFDSEGDAQSDAFKVFDTATNLEWPDVTLTTNQGTDIVVADADIFGQKVTGLTAAKGGAKGGGPTAPSDFIGVSNSPTSISYTWKDNSKDETKFILADTQTNKALASIAANATSYTESNLTPNTSYGRAVASFNDNGYGISSYITAWTLASTPSGLSATLKAREITLAWTGDGSKYKVWRGTSADGPWTVAGDNVKDKSLNDTGLLPETTYWYKVAPYNGGDVLAPACDPGSFKTGGASALAPQIGAGKHLKTNLAVAKSDNISSDGNLKFVFTDPNISVGGKINYVKVVFLDAAGNEVAKKEYTEAPESIKLDSPLPPGTYTAKVYTTSSTGTSTEKEITGLKVSNVLEITVPPVVHPLVITRSLIKAQGVAATQMAYQLSKDGNVSMVIYGVDGQIVYRGDYNAGTNGGSAGPNAVSWDGYAHFTRAPAGRGLYFVQFIDRDSKQLLGKAVVHVQ